jgi:hypothetical protein
MSISLCEEREHRGCDLSNLSCCYHSVLHECQLSGMGSQRAGEGTMQPLAHCVVQAMVSCAVSLSLCIPTLDMRVIGCASQSDYRIEQKNR